MVPARALPEGRVPSEQVQPDRNEGDGNLPPTPAAQVAPVAPARPALQFSVSLPWDQLLFLATNLATIYLKHKANMADLEAKRIELRGKYPRAKF